jgi:Tol biopolymer transport system component
VWGAPVRVPGLSDGGTSDVDPFIAAYGRKLWYSSTRTGNGDLYTAERASPSDPFLLPVPLTELNTSSIEEDPILSPDFRTILFASNRGGGNIQIYAATR